MKIGGGGELAVAFWPMGVYSVFVKVVRASCPPGADGILRVAQTGGRRTGTTIRRL